MSTTPWAPTPPPEQPLDDAARARLRERVVAGLDSTSTATKRSWRMPVAAAAAVLVVAGVTGAVATRADDGPRSNGQPAAPESTEDPGNDLTVVPTDEVTSEAAAPAAGPKECPSNLRYVLKGAEPAVAFELPSGSPAAFYVKGDRWSLCDERAGIVTVSQPLKLDERYADQAVPFRMSMNFYDPDGGQDLVASFVAGGLAPDGAEDFFDLLTYTFPDGHVAEADLVTDEQGRTWWYVEYVATEGLLVAPETNYTKLGPIAVDLALSGVAYQVELTWLEDTCAQANQAAEQPSPFRERTDATGRVSSPTRPLPFALPPERGALPLQGPHEGRVLVAHQGRFGVAHATTVDGRADSRVGPCEWDSPAVWRRARARWRRCSPSLVPW